MKVIRIIPSILAYTRHEFNEKLERVEAIVDRVQVDIVGKVFSSEVTVGVETLEDISSAVNFDVQLMVENPVGYLNRCDQGGTDRVFGHVEEMKNIGDFIEHALALGMQVGLGVDLLTPISEIEEYIDDLDAVLLMSVPAGKSGQDFDERVLEKILEVRKLNAYIPICIDGGINDKNIGSCVKSGAQEFAVGKFLWESKDINETINLLLEGKE